MILNSRVKYALTIYIVLVIIIVIIKPKFFFKKDGQFKAFGTGPDRTAIPFWLVLLVFAIIAFYLSNLLILIKL